MVPQMIVAVANGDVECDPPEELFEIGSDMILGAAHLQELREIKIACPFALILTQKRHRRSIESPASSGSIEAPHAEGMVVAVRQAAFGILSWPCSTAAVGRSEIRELAQEGF
jgi:hypothetical protein